MKKEFVQAMAAILLLAGTACNDTNDDKAEPYAANTADQAEQKNAADAAVDENTSDFMIKAANGGMLEVLLGEMAQRNASNQAVKDFGQMMVTDHTKANNELKALASARNVTLPATAEGNHREHANDLGKKTGAEFDRDYMDMMVKDHNETVEMFENAANNSSDAAVKAFAAKTLPTLKAHQEAAKNLQQQLKQMKK
jgi:putative membrane protein